MQRRARVVGVFVDCILVRAWRRLALRGSAAASLGCARFATSIMNVRLLVFWKHAWFVRGGVYSAVLAFKA